MTMTTFEQCFNFLNDVSDMPVHKFIQFVFGNFFSLKVLCLSRLPTRSNYIKELFFLVENVECVLEKKL